MFEPSPLAWAPGNSTNTPAGMNAFTLQILLITGSSLSIAGSGFIILSYFLFPDSRKFSRKILLYLSLADICASSAWVLHYVAPNGGDTLCFAQGYMLQFFYLASYLWTGCFAWHLYQLIDARNRTPKSLEALYHFLSWGIPLLVR